MKSFLLPCLLFTVILATTAASCEISEVEQPETVETGQTIEIKLTISNEVADPNAWKGIVAVLVPEDWEFVSGTYEAAFGEGELEPFDDYLDWMNEIEEAPEGMKWLVTRTDEAYAHGEDQFFDVVLELKVGNTTGTFDLGYYISKDAYATLDDLLAFRDYGSLAFSLEHEITVILGSSTKDDAGIPVSLTLDQNYPNPFNPATTITFTLREAGNVRLAVYDLSGRQVAVVADRHFPAGDHVETFRAGELPSGTYVYRLESAGHQVSRSMVLMK
jgi:hypothetical protein